MSNFGLALLWLIPGYIGSLFAIYIFRRDGRSDKAGELYLATIGPLFGPVVIVLLGMSQQIKNYPARRKSPGKVITESLEGRIDD